MSVRCMCGATWHICGATCAGLKKQDLKYILGNRDTDPTDVHCIAQSRFGFRGRTSASIFGLIFAR